MPILITPLKCERVKIYPPSPQQLLVLCLRGREARLRDFLRPRLGLVFTPTPQ